MRGFEILQDAIDFHMHPGPSTQKRREDFIEFARGCQSVGMRAINIKPIEYPTMDRAYAVERTVPGLKSFGGILLDRCVGGLNPPTVLTAVKLGAKCVYMPLADSMNTKVKLGRVKIYQTAGAELSGLTIIDEKKELLPEVHEILDILAQNKHVVLATGHLSVEEDLILLREANKKGLSKLVVNHPVAEIIGATLEDQKRMVDYGACLDHVFIYCLPRSERPGQDPMKIVGSIKTIGAAHCIMSSDAGNFFSPPPHEVLRSFVAVMMGNGISEKEIDIMIRQNPAKLLDLGQSTS